MVHAIRQNTLEIWNFLNRLSFLRQKYIYMHKHMYLQLHDISLKIRKRNWQQWLLLENEAWGSLYTCLCILNLIPYICNIYFKRNFTKKFIFLYPIYLFDFLQLAAILITWFLDLRPTPSRSLSRVNLVYCGIPSF